MGEVCQKPFTTLHPSTRVHGRAWSEPVNWWQTRSASRPRPRGHLDHPAPYDRSHPHVGPKTQGLLQNRGMLRLGYCRHRLLVRGTGDLAVETHEKRAEVARDVNAEWLKQPCG